MLVLQINKLTQIAVIALLAFTPVASAEPLRIASWNIEWLDTTPAQRQQERTPADYRTLRAYADKLDADVIAFQEVADSASATRLFPASEYQIILSSRHNDQKVGFAIRNHLQITQLPELKTLDLHGRQSLRYGLAVEIKSASQSVRLLNVHLKAGCFNNRSEQQQKRRKNCQQLHRQAAYIADWADNQPRDIPVVILGDFNRQLKNTADTLWQRLNNSGNLSYTGNNNSKACISRRYDKKSRQWQARSYKTYIDQILLNDAARQHLVSNSFRQHVYRKNDVLKHYLSDHCPISVKLDFQ